MEFPASSVRQLYIDFQEQPEGAKGQWLEEQKAKKNAHYTGNQYMEEELFKKLSREWIQTEKYDEYLKERSAKMSGSIFSDEGTFAWRNAKVTPAAYEKLKGTKLSFDLSDGVIKATKADFTDLCMTILLMAAVYFLILDEKKNKLYPLLRSASRGRAEVIGAKLGVMAGITGFLVLLLYGSNYLFIFHQYGFGNLTRPLQSVTAFYESPFRLTAGQYLWMYLLLKCGCIADDMDCTKGRDTGRSDSRDQHRSSCGISADRAAPVSLLCGRTEVYQSCGVYQNISAFYEVS
mgnify:CR=1 FL=1